MPQLPARTPARILVSCVQVIFLGRNITRRLPLVLICQLGLLRRCFSPSIAVQVKKVLYITLKVTFKMLFSSMATSIHQWLYHTGTGSVVCCKIYTEWFSTMHWQRLISQKLLPLTYFLQLLNILFFLKCLKFPDRSFPILNFASFSNTKTISSSFSKLMYNPCSSELSQHSYIVVFLLKCMPLEYPTSHWHLSSFLNYWYA